MSEKKSDKAKDSKKVTKMADVVDPTGPPTANPPEEVKGQKVERPPKSIKPKAEKAPKEVKPKAEKAPKEKSGKKAPPPRGPKYAGKMSARDFIKSYLIANEGKPQTKQSVFDALIAHWECGKKDESTLHSHRSTSDQLFIDFANPRYAGKYLALEGFRFVRVEDGKPEFVCRKATKEEAKAFEEFEKSEVERKAKAREDRNEFAKEVHEDLEAERAAKVAARAAKKEEKSAVEAPAPTE
jgi:hypothetical protein